MKLYSVDSPASSFDSILIDGEHKWMLPGMDCPKCGVWISTGHEFPCIEPRREQQRFFIDGPMPLGWFKEVLPPSGIRRPDGSMPGPAEAFGRFTGRVCRGTVATDFIRPVSWMILVRESAMKKLVAAGLRFSGFAEADLKKSAKLREPIYEIQITDGLLLDESCVDRHGPDCPMCGRRPISLKDGPLKLKGKSSRVQHDIFRAANFATKIFATEKLKQTCQENGFTSISFTEVKHDVREI